MRYRAEKSKDNDRGDRGPALILVTLIALAVMFVPLLCMARNEADLSGVIYPRQ
jgi:hypothetical protein